MKIAAMGYVGFSSPNHQVWKTFGPQMLGLGLAADGADGSVRLRVDERHHRITVHPGQSDELEYMGWELRGRVEFEHALKHLEQRGVSYREASAQELENRRVIGMASFQDPQNFRHEIYYGQQFDYGTFVPGQPMHGFVAGDLGLGHCVLIVPELTRELQDFAVEVMGFKTYWPVRWPPPAGRAEMYRCNARSHCLVYLEISGMRGIDHFYIDTKHMDDVGRAYSRCLAQNIVVKELGRYVQDDDVSFYVRTPSSVDIQYATGGRLYTDEEAWVNPGSMTSTLVWGHKVLLPGLNPMIRPVGK